MRNKNETSRRRFFHTRSLAASALALLLVACGGGGGSDDGGGVTPPTTGTLFEAPPSTSQTVVGAIGTGEPTVQAQTVAPGTSLTLDNRTAPVALDAEGRFEIRSVTDGNHSLFVHHPDGTTTEIPFRMLEGRSLSLGRRLLPPLRLQRFPFRLRR